MFGFGSTRTPVVPSTDFVSDNGLLFRVEDSGDLPAWLEPIASSMKNGGTFDYACLCDLKQVRLAGGKQQGALRE